MMVKKQVKELELIEISEEEIAKMGKLRGSVIKEFFKIDKDEGEDAILGIFIKNGLKTIGVEIEDPYEQLDMATFALVLEKVLEENNLEQLFRTFERLNRTK
jgi:hypothetical protein